MFVGECERRGEFLVGTRLRDWDWEHENLDMSLASGSEIDVFVIFGELQECISSRDGSQDARTHGDRGRGPVPMRRQRVRLILLQVVDDKNGTIRLIPILSKFSPGDFDAISAEDRGMRGTVVPRGDFLTVLTLEIDDIDLGI